LNIEAVFQQKMGYFQEFNNLCFVDTLDNVQALNYKNKQDDMFGAISLENVARIQRQNEKTISVIIGNPPYNAKQENYNFQNANRAYADIDKRIKETYIKQGTAQNQIVVYDMYTRFYRWASDRLDKNGILAFVTNRSFIDSRAFDGFRKIVETDFSEIYIVDLGGNIRGNYGKNLKIGNVFGIQTGVCIGFFVKNEALERGKCRIFYFTLKDEQRKEEKLDFLRDNPLSRIPFERIVPDNKGNWINQTENDFDQLIPLIDKEVKAGKSQQAIFQLFSRGVVSQRDEWVFDFSKDNLESKMRYFVDIYQNTVGNNEFEDKFKIKWDSELTSYSERKICKEFEADKILVATYRPFVKKYFYFDKHFNGRLYQWENIVSVQSENKFITFTSFGSNRNFNCLVIDTIGELHVTGANQCLPLYRYEDSQRIENITDWALKLFRARYCQNRDSQDFQDAQDLENCAPKNPAHPENPTNPSSDRKIEKLDIFHYVYAVLHDPRYRQKYAQNLKRDFPRIPLHDDFWRWATWGKQLITLHIDYETAPPYPLRRDDKPLKNPAAKPKVKLKADKTAGKIEIDEITTLSEIPVQAWEYQLGNRSALEWILDQYKEKTPSDKTILEKFNRYQFADYKEQVIDLLQKVCTVSVETMKIIDRMI